MSNLSNIKRSISNVLGVATTLVAVGTEVLSDVSGGAVKAIGSTPEVTKELLRVPFTATEGYLVENGMDVEEAAAKANKYLNQPVVDTVKQLSKLGGKGIAIMLAEDD